MERSVLQRKKSPWDPLDFKKSSKSIDTGQMTSVILWGPPWFLSVCGPKFHDCLKPVLTHRQSKPPLNFDQEVSELGKVLNPLKCHGLDSVLSNWVNLWWCVAECVISWPYHFQNHDLNSTQDRRWTGGLKKTEVLIFELYFVRIMFITWIPGPTPPLSLFFSPSPQPFNTHTHFPSINSFISFCILYFITFHCIDYKKIDMDSNPKILSLTSWSYFFDIV